MADPYTGEIRMFAGNFAPAGWAFCQGQLLSISQYQSLYMLIGTTYGGDGQSTFALPDLQSSMPMHQGSNQGVSYVIGESGGTETVTLTNNQMPPHSHAFRIANGAGTQVSPHNAYLAGTLGGGHSSTRRFTTSAGNTVPNAVQLGITGGSLPHENMSPFLVMNFIICLDGIYPTTH
jgi:microcystin-dependent protein